MQRVATSPKFSKFGFFCNKTGQFFCQIELERILLFSLNHKISVKKAHFSPNRSLNPTTTFTWVQILYFNGPLV